MANTAILLPLFCMLSLLALSVAIWLHERGAFDAIARFLPRSRAERVLLALVAVGFIHYGATKETNGVRGVSAPLRNVPQRSQAPDFVLSSFCTNDVFDFSVPSNAVIHEKWRRRGAAHDRFSLSPAGWTFPVGDTSVTNLTVCSEGSVRLPDGTEIAPLPATHGIVPEGNWPLLAESNRPSLFWHSLAADGSLVLAWQNVLLHRTATNPVSFLAELKPSGSATFRYDLSRLASDGLLDGIAPSAGGVAQDAPLSRSVTGVDFKSRKEADCDTFRAEFEESLGDLDPFSFPEGSTNTVLEHLFYSSTTNGAFFYPQTNDSTAVLRVSVSGTGSGDLLVGGAYVPLVGVVQRRGAEAQSNCLMLPVSKGRTVPLYQRGDGTLSVSFDSGEFAFGELPDIAENRYAGWINFPNTKATEPCIHDLGRKTKDVTLPASSGAEGLACTWQGGGDAEVENHPPRSATLTATFDPKESGGITYVMSHPKYLFGRTVCAQTVRYCPRPGDDEPSFPEEGEEEDGGDDWCDCCGWSCGECGCPASCGCSCCDHGICPEHSVPYGECEGLHPDDYDDAATNAVATLAGVLYIRDPPLAGDHIVLEVPTNHVNCCPCPDHNTNCVGIAYRSHRLRVTDSEGMPFFSASADCTVDVAGVEPSEAVGDAELAFARNGEVYGRRGYTVLGVGIRRDGIPLERYNDLAPSFGYPMTVCTNQWNAPEMLLVTNVRLPTGRMRIELANATGRFAVWCRDGDGWRRLADTSAAADFPMHSWKAVMRGAGCGGSPELPVRITSSSPGTARLVFRYWAVIDGAFVEDAAEQRITSVNPPLLADYNRDGRVDAVDVLRYICGGVVYFWRNNDTWKNDDAFSSSSEMNSSDWVVNGRCDLVNFLPIAVNIAPFVSYWSFNEVEYRIEPMYSGSLRNAKLACADISWANVGDAMLGEDSDINGSAIYEASVSALGAGTNLPPAFVSLSQTGRSTLFMEFPEEDRSNRLSLNIYSKADGARLYSQSIRLHVGDVAQMVGWQNLRGAAGGSGGVPTRFTTPDWPADEHEPGNVVFVHGYNMEEDVETPLWAQNVFKKLWWSGLDRGFVAVQWNGDRGQVLGTLTPNYYGNVQNAFATASALKTAMDGIAGAKWFLAHSLGNMLVSAAIQDYGMPHEKFFMLNAAIAMEALDPMNGITQTSHDMMTPSAWTNYADRVRATHWHERFPEGDGRRLLTWKGRFANVTNIVNFYSTQEEVVNNGDGNWHTIVTRNYVWYNQETRKGLWPLMLHEYEGGWEFNSFYDTVTGSWLGNEYVEERHHMNPTNAATLTDAQLQQIPFFLDFNNPEMRTSPNGAIVATNYLYRAEMLAYAIPAESFAVGANPIPGLTEMYTNSIPGKLYYNHDMASLFASGRDDLPENHATDTKKKHRDWQHSTFVQRSYKRVHQLYKEIVKHIKEAQHE